jgi:DNA-binding MarR family transcriptional regulator
LTLHAKPHLRRDNLGYLLAKAVQRWNGMLQEGFRREGFGEVRPSFGSVLIPLYEEDGLRPGELARRSQLTKQTMTTMVRAVEAARLVRQRPDPQDGRASRVWLTEKARRFMPIAERVLGEIEGLVARESAPADLEAVRRWLNSFTQHRERGAPDLRTTNRGESI